MCLALLEGINYCSYQWGDTFGRFLALMLEILRWNLRRLFFWTLKSSCSCLVSTPEYVLVRGYLYPANPCFSFPLPPLLSFLCLDPFLDIHTPITKQIQILLYYSFCGTLSNQINNLWLATYLTICYWNSLATSDILFVHEKAASST